MILYNLIASLVFFIIPNNFCQCETPQEKEEFNSSKYVFKGQLIKYEVSKSDRDLAIITFKVLEHYKKSDKPDIIKFEINNKKRVWTSCDTEVEVGEIWKVYTSEYNGRLTFGEMCSNTKRLGKKTI